MSVWCQNAIPSSLRQYCFLLSMTSRGALHRRPLIGSVRCSAQTGCFFRHRRKLTSRRRRYSCILRGTRSHAGLLYVHLQLALKVQFAPHYVLFYSLHSVALYYAIQIPAHSLTFSLRTPKSSIYDHGRHAGSGAHSGGSTVLHFRVSRTCFRLCLDLRLVRMQYPGIFLL